MTRRSAPILSVARLAAMALALVLGARASAQGTHIPCELASGQRFSDEDKKQIAAHAAEGLQLLSSTEPGAVQRAREQLVTPLRCSEVSAAFRIEYSRALESGLKAAIASSNDQSAANALMVAGMIASTGSLQIVESALTSPREPVRAAASVALQSTLREQTLGRVRLTGAVIEKTLRSASVQLAKESSPAVVEEMVVALRAGAVAGPAGSAPDETLATQSMRALGKGAAGAFAGARKAQDSDHMGWAHAAARTTDTIWRTTYDAQVRSLDREQAVACAEACAQILAYARDRSADDASPMTDDERGVLAKAMETTEAALILINSRITSEPSSRKGLADAFTRGGDAFSREADKWIGASGRLTKDPYGLDAKTLAPR